MRGWAKGADDGVRDDVYDVSACFGKNAFCLRAPVQRASIFKWRYAEMNTQGHKTWFGKD